LILDVVDFALVLLEELCISFVEDRECALLLIILFRLNITVNLRLDKAAFELLKLAAESIEYTLYSLLLLLEPGRRCQHGQLFLLDFECQLVAHLAQLFLEIYFVADGLLRLIRQESELL